MIQLDSNVSAKLEQVRTIIFDVDGVLTDGGLIYDENGQEFKRFHARDGHGMKMLQEAGVAIAIITGRKSPVVTNRCAELGIAHVHQGCHDKAAAFESLAMELQLNPKQFAYLGDDVVDLPVMCRVGAPLAVADAHERVRRNACWVSRFNGGHGAAREACELIMHAQGTLEAALSVYEK
ncbi:MAG: HAD family hydrolase [Pseudomonadota bacterium]